MRAVFVNPELCIGCRQCEIACAVEHSAGQDETTAFLELPVPRARVHVEAGPVVSTAFPNRCRHCDPAPCLQVCPTGAITRDAQYGLVLVNARRCIGCAMCAVVCPFDVITFYPLAEGPSPSTAVAVKCDGCIDRQRNGREPACAEVCKVDALVYGDLNELLRAGRLRQSGTALAAAASPPRAATPDPLAGWHAFGEDLVEVAAAAQTATGNGHRKNGIHPVSTASHEGGAR